MSIGHALLAFAVAAGLLTITPGLDTALVLRTAAVEGPRRAMMAAAGICLGLLTWGFTASVGIGALLSASRVAYNVLRISGACYLIFLGTKMFLRQPSSFCDLGSESIRVQTESVRGTAPRWFARGFLTNILNPKVGVFYITFLPQFIPSGVAPTTFSMFLATVHAAEGIIWFLILTLATRSLSSWLQRPKIVKTLDRTTGTILAGFGLKLILDTRR
jgi:threonine/homoserine/homoserine lactone efflux protein